MSKKQKKKSGIDWKTVIISAILDFIVGLMLLLIGKYIS